MLLVTTNDTVTQETETLEATTFDFPQAATMESLAEKRVIVESRGDPDEYLALAREYAIIGADANATNLRRKAAGMKAVRS